MENVLVLCDDMWHPAEVVEKGLAPLQDEAAHFDFVKDAKDILTVDMLNEYAVIMNCKGDNINCGNHEVWFEKGVTEVGPQELEAYVQNGGGFLSVHAGNAFFAEQTPDYTAFVGNCFVGHPPRCDVRISVLKEHPVTRGVEDFAIRDEHYHIDLLTQDAELLLQSQSASGGIQTAGYVRTMGAGRICVLTPGHILAVWRHPMFQRLLVNALHWCARKKRA